jgi:hypothetical protein
MIKSSVLFAFLLVFITPLHGQSSQVSGAWCESSVKWTKPPAELHLDERSAQAGLLYFGPNNQFALIYGTVIQGANWETLSHGDGRVVYLGTWTLEGTVVRVEYRLVSRTIRKDGEKLPGPFEKRSIQSKGEVLIFDRARFHRETRLDDQLLAVLQGEGARQGKTGQP